METEYINRKLYDMYPLYWTALWGFLLSSFIFVV